ncbi:hypothetical protein PV325_009354 [Microctonus aethiopoides]|nr:hypothetical protein PV325_009354 [Microctonus aethiopoides]
MEDIVVVWEVKRKVRGACGKDYKEEKRSGVSRGWQEKMRKVSGVEGKGERWLRRVNDRDVQGGTPKSSVPGLYEFLLEAELQHYYAEIKGMLFNKFHPDELLRCTKIVFLDVTITILGTC